MGRSFSSLEEALHAVASGRPVIVVDAEDRENEGDFVVAADKIAPATIHFMIRQGGGQLCMPIMPDVARRLQLLPMAPGGSDSTMPGFTIPVDHHACRTGISPAERSRTILSILDPDSQPGDFVRPGHVFPIVARSGGVLERTGHTEAAVDLARLAGLEPAGVLCEICSRDGQNMAGRDELFDISAEFQLPIVTIDAILYHRRSQATTQRSLAGRETWRC
jgi:3,4-dihydroxy 2-butanone 4-phosphate synthase/GTP cyclohydrolase II